MPSIRINNLQLAVEEPEEALMSLIARRLKLLAADITSWRILRKSLDARVRKRLKFVYSVVVEISDDQAAARLIQQHPEAVNYHPDIFYDPPAGNAPLEHRPVIVGSGPAGMLAGYYLAVKGFRPLILERGEPVKQRVQTNRAFNRGENHHPENNYLFGEGGAGCFSDGKLTCRMSGPDVDWVLRRLVDCGGKESIVYEHRPHLGSNRLPFICRNFRREIEVSGGEYRFGCCLEGIDITEGKLRGVMTSGGYFPAEQVILAIGHSARDTYHMLYELGVPFEQKAFQLGLRIEQPQSQINHHKYGRDSYLELLGAADYSLIAKGQRDLFTFCMCAGGEIIPSVSEEQHFCTNGMSNSRHDTPYANSGLMVTLEPAEFGSSHPLAGMELQRQYEHLAFELSGSNYLCPIQPANDFLAGQSADQNATYQCSYQRGTTPLNLEAILPATVVQAIRTGLPLLDRKWKGEFLKSAMLVGPEMRGSAPVRIVRNRESFQTPGISGLYPVGEGAGYAGGIITAAVDGLRAARKLVEKFSPLT